MVGGEPDEAGIGDRTREPDAVVLEPVAQRHQWMGLRLEHPYAHDRSDGGKRSTYLVEDDRSGREVADEGRRQPRDVALRVTEVDHGSSVGCVENLVTTRVAETRQRLGDEQRARSRTTRDHETRFEHGEASYLKESVR